MIRFLFGLVVFIFSVRFSDGQPLGNHRVSLHEAQMEQRILASIRSILPQLGTSDTCGGEKNMESKYLSALKDTIKDLTTRLDTLEKRFDRQLPLLHICKLLFEKVTANATVHVFEDRCFLSVTQRMNWSAAQKRCQLVGANLISVMSKDMHDFIVPMVRGLGLWIGATRRRVDNKFAWIRNDLLLEDSYTNWFPGQSNDDTTNCVATDFKGWHDSKCSYELRFICEL